MIGRDGSRKNSIFKNSISKLLNFAIKNCSRHRVLRIVAGRGFEAPLFNFCVKFNWQESNKCSKFYNGVAFYCYNPFPRQKKTKLEQNLLQALCSLSLSQIDTRTVSLSDTTSLFHTHTFSNCHLSHSLSLSLSLNQPLNTPSLTLTHFAALPIHKITYLLPMTTR